MNGKILKMKEIGGFIEFERYSDNMLHKNGVKLNCGRNCLAYVFKVKKISKIYLPYFLCDSIEKICKKYNVKCNFYHIDEKFRPIINDIDVNEWVYVVNYYGQLPREYMNSLYEHHHNIIFDFTQSYYEMPIKNAVTLYSCRKFFGVSDGGIVYIDTSHFESLEYDQSFERMHYLMGRFECGASAFYSEFCNREKEFENEPIKFMSKLTQNILCSLDYDCIRKKREKNFEVLEKYLQKFNRLKLVKRDGPFMYPLWVHNGKNVRKQLIEQKVYIPILWPNVIEKYTRSYLEYDMAENILPIPCDQRYDEDDMLTICYLIDNFMKERTV